MRNSQNRGSFPTKSTRYSEEQIIGAPKQIEAGQKVADPARELGVSEASVYTWKSKFRRAGVSEALRPKELEDENRRLKHLVADLTLEKKVLKSVVVRRRIASEEFAEEGLRKYIRPVW